MKIESTSDLASPSIKMVIAGESGNGKTSLAATLGEPVLVISAEAGLLSLRGKGIDFVELQRKWDEEKKAYVEIPKHLRIARLIEIFEFVKRPETIAKYKWLFIDSLTEINFAMLDFLESMEDFQGPKNKIKLFGELASRMRSLCKSFRDLPSYSVVFTALVKTDTDSDGKITLKIDMTGKFSDSLPALFDQIAYLGVLPEVDEVTQKNKRVILNQKTDKVTFPKDRSGALDRVEPADLSVIVKKIRSKSAPIIDDVSGKAKAAHVDHRKLMEKEIAQAEKLA